MNKKAKQMVEHGKYIKFLGKTYALNLEKLKEVCFSSSLDGKGTKEIEISQAYERQDNGEFALSSKLEHETKMFGNTQNDMAVYDVVKLLLVSILETNAPEDDHFNSLSLSLSINTLLSWGILEEIE